MGGGVGVGNFSAAAVIVASPEWAFFWKTVSSRLGLRTEISARYYREKTRTGVPHLFCFHGEGEKYEELSIF